MVVQYSVDLCLIPVGWHLGQFITICPHITSIENVLRFSCLFFSDINNILKAPLLKLIEILCVCVCVIKMQ